MGEGEGEEAGRGSFIHRKGKTVRNTAKNMHKHSPYTEAAYLDCSQM